MWQLTGCGNCVTHWYSPIWNSISNFIGNFLANPDPEASSALTSSRIQQMACVDSVDCSEIATAMRRATGSGSIVRVNGSNPSTPDLVVPQANGPDTFTYHEVFMDDRGFIYDPRLSSEPIPYEDWQNMMIELNPGMRLFSPRSFPPDIIY